MSVRQAELPFDVLARIPHASLDEIEICCDTDHHVFNAEHTDADVTKALEGTHWFEVHEWATSGPGAGANAA
jgi:hypothetical protein